jgi:hypothetical protein
MHHEDAFLLNKALENLKIKEHTSAPRHHISTDAPRISIEKTLDPIVQRSVQNIGLLLHDYVNQLPAFDASNAETEKLLEHWREIMLEHPQRLATSHMSHGHDEKTKNFWRGESPRGKPRGISLIQAALAPYLPAPVFGYTSESQTH